MGSRSFNFGIIYIAYAQERDTEDVEEMDSSVDTATPSIL